MRLIDQEIAHVARVMTASLHKASTNLILTPEYWHKRLSDLLDTAQLSQSQFRTVDTLMSQIERMLADAAPARARAA
jgi:hypothetical protein